MTVSHRGFSAWISCEGRILPEFEVATDSKTHRVTCWIPSYEGKAFVIHWKDHGSKIDTAAYIQLDGFVCAGRFLAGEGEAYREGVRTGPSAERPFTFSKVPDGEKAGEGMTTSRANLGTIILKIRRVKRLAEKESDAPRQVPDRMQGPQKVGDHCIGFGQERETWLQHPKTFSTQPYDRRSPGSYVTFVFRYRSPDFLQAQGIISSISEVPQFTEEEEQVLSRTSSGPITPRATPSPKQAARALSGGVRRPPGIGQAMRTVSNQSNQSNQSTGSFEDPTQTQSFKDSIFVWSSRFPTSPDPTNPYLPMKKDDKDDDEDMTDDT